MAVSFLGGTNTSPKRRKKPFFLGLVTTVSRWVMIRRCTRCWVITESCVAIIFSISREDTILSFASLSVRNIRMVFVSFSRSKAIRLSVHWTSRLSESIRFSISLCTKNREKSNTASNKVYPTVILTLDTLFISRFIPEPQP